ncbi:MAG: DNA polymerase I [Bacteroidales bacterium]|jgi:DNA polymerase-1|nr:DNA polymerase I [Bacteroidales bacterium]
MTKKLFLIDGHAMLYRSYYAFIKNPRINSKGVNTSGIFGFTNAINEIIRNQKPSHIGVVFDPKGTTFRHELYEQYKANRQETPEDLRASIPHVMEILQGMNIPVIQIEGYEADDVIGTLAKQAAKQGFEVFMVTPDKDYCQLVEEHIYIYRPRSFGNGIEILGIPEVKEKFSVNNPMQVIDILGLWGDSVDNIPGAPGIGEKTAKALIAHYHSIEGVYEHIDELKGKQKENLITFKPRIMLSKQLATIKIDVPIDFNSYNFEKQECNPHALQAKFMDLEFRNMLNSIQTASSSASAVKEKPQPTGAMQLDLFGETPEQKPEIHYVSSFNTIETTNHSYFLVDNQSHIQKLIHDLLAQPEFCFDTETTSLNILHAELCGISFSFEKGKAFYVPFPENQEETRTLVQQFAPVFSSSALKIAHNAKYDCSMLKNYGIDVAAPLFDTMIAHYVLQPEGRHKLESLAESYLHYEMMPIERLIGKKGVLQRSFRSVPLSEAKEYSSEDADITWQLYPILKQELIEKNQLQLFETIEMPLVEILSAMERSGVKINIQALEEYSQQLKAQVAEIEQKIYDLASEQFNIASPKQLGEILFDKLQLVDKAKKTKTKQYATGEEVLAKLKHTHPIVAAILEFRELKKLLSTYVDALPLLVDPQTGRVHASFNQTVVATGRLSSSNPNLQNIPVRTQNGREIRKAFIPFDENQVFVSADYSQIELRVIASMSGDENFIAAFVNGEDIHAATAAKIFSCNIASVTAEQRRQAKSANFAISYGSSAFGLAQGLNISRKEAQFLIDGYFASYPKIKEFMNTQIEKARAHGYVETLFGRRRYLPDIYSQNAIVRGVAERNAINAPIQGTAADIMKLAMIHIFTAMKKHSVQSQLIMQVHDELNFTVLRSEIELMKKIITEGMEHAVQLSVPIVADIGVGANWLEAH